MQTTLGQPRVFAQLQRAIHSGRLAHTWIFSGPLGVGKFRTAVALAKTSMCDSPLTLPNGSLPQPNPLLPPDFPIKLACESCDSCRAITGGGAASTTGNHPDLHIITKELIRYHDTGGKSKGTTIGIDVIRGEITGDTDAGKEPKIYKRAFRGHGKWFIIDEADLMLIPAQNSLLKTLEEPPADSFLVLITTSPNELLSTIRSRAQLATFNQLPDDILLPALLAQGLPEPDAQLLARLAHGSLGRATRWAQDIATIATKNAAAAARQARANQRAVEAGEGSDDDDDTPPAFSPGGILAWTRRLTTALDGLLDGSTSASELAAVLLAIANESAALQLIRDPLTSKDRAIRDAIALLLGISADYFTDRLRQSLSTPHPLPLPSNADPLAPDLIHPLLAAARTAETQIDMNANVNLLLSATCTEWENILHA